MVIFLNTGAKILYFIVKGGMFSYFFSCKRQIFLSLCHILDCFLYLCTRETNNRHRKHCRQDGCFPR